MLFRSAGKILRIHPKPEGGYSIPEGNLFKPGTAGTRPEVYVMGNRNPFRISVDPANGYLYWGEVGPDANEDTALGPRGYDELNQARGPGNFGWPYFIGANHAYPWFDYVANQPRAPKDPKHPVNASVNNTGLRELPPAQPAFISYPYGASERFPLVGSGSRSAVGGPVFRQADFPGAKRAFPAYYEGKWLAADLARGWIMAIGMNAAGELKISGTAASDSIIVDAAGANLVVYVNRHLAWSGSKSAVTSLTIDAGNGDDRITVSTTLILNS